MRSIFFLDVIIENRCEREGVIVLIQEDPVKMFQLVVSPPAEPGSGLSRERTPEDLTGLAVLPIVVRAGPWGGGEPPPGGTGLLR